MRGQALCGRSCPRTHVRRAFISFAAKRFSRQLNTAVWNPALPSRCLLPVRSALASIPAPRTAAWWGCRGLATASSATPSTREPAAGPSDLPHYVTTVRVITDSHLLAHGWCPRRTYSTVGWYRHMVDNV